MKPLSYIPAFLRNKYAVSALAFAVWMIFFDKNDYFTQRDRQQELEALKESKQYYIDQISQERKVLQELQSNPAAIEKYAREKFRMKRENEDLFIIQEVR